jgi:membrane protein implicated in regulation of membrane protease activity
MTESTIWFLFAGMLLILEIFTGTFYLLMIAIGFVAGSMAALAGFALTTQLIFSAAVGLLATFLLHRSKLGKSHSRNARSDPNINLDIGQTIVIKHWLISSGVPAKARVTYRGAPWDVELMPDAIPQPGNFIVREIRGSHLIVSPSA